MEKTTDNKKTGKKTINKKNVKTTKAAAGKSTAQTTKKAGNKNFAKGPGVTKTKIGMKKGTSVKGSAKQDKPKNQRISLSERFGIGIVLAAAIYLILTFYFTDHFFPGTEINGYTCQFKTVEQVKEMIKEGCENYELVLKQREDKEEKISASQISLQFVDDDKIQNIKKEQKNYSWIRSVFEKPVYENAVSITYDEDALVEAVDSLECLQKENTKEPKAAYPSYIEERGQFEIVGEELGTKVDKEAIAEEIRNALLSDRRELNLNDAGCYEKPAFYSSDTAIVEAQEKMNRYLSTEITYDMGYTTVKVDKSEIAKWLTVDKEANVVVDEEKVGDYVEWLGNHYNTCGIRRKFKTPENTTVTVSGGTYGWRIHYQKEVEQLIEDVKTGEKMIREPIYRQTAYNRDENGNDLHQTYIAISLKAQTMWYYKDGQCLLTTPVVTGNTSKKMGTPTGVYEIAFKKKGHVLRGEDYESPVDYWMPFYEYRGIGIHDASWRAAGAFGGDIYKTNGSHGCVNTPYEAVKTLFEIVKTGTPVVVY